MTTSKTITTNRRLGRRLILVLALGVAAAFMAAPASGFAATTFGAKLNKTIQPSNSLPAQPCTMPAKSCTRIEMDAYNDPGHERAPKDGVIKKVKLIAGGPGHFKLQIAEAKPGKDKGRVVRNGPRIDYNGTGLNGPTYHVESFPVHVPVEKGQYLAISAKKTSMLRCSSGGPNQFLFTPALSPGGPFQTLSYTDGCWLLLEAVYQ
jgi:hypothetical protein